MARSYYSTVFEQAANQLWAVIRDFGSYSWFTSDPVECYIEQGKSGKEVGAIRNVSFGDRHIRQRLLAHSDLGRFYTYEFCEPSPYPLVHNYQATLRFTPIVDGNRTFVEWWATFDCATDEEDRWIAYFNDSFAKWLKSLRDYISAHPL